MGRYNLSARKVHAHATQLLMNRHISAPPPWFSVIGSIPSSEVLTRKPMRPQKSNSKRRASRLFSPVQLEHKEDKLRWEFFNDHPWELARPRVVVEQDGRDAEKWDWSHPLTRPQWKLGNAESTAEVKAWSAKDGSQVSRPLNGEAVVQRQQWLMEKQGLSQAAAYDKARKEFYAERHKQEIEQRIAREEALFSGAVFGKSAIEVGMMLEDQAYEDWRIKSASDIALQKANLAGMYSGNEDESESGIADFEEIADSIPGSRTGQDAYGGAAIHP